MSVLENSIKQHLYNLHKEPFAVVSKAMVKSFIMNIIEIAILIIVIRHVFPEKIGTILVIPVIMYNFYLSIKNSVMLTISRVLMRQMKNIMDNKLYNLVKDDIHDAGTEHDIFSEFENNVSEMAASVVANVENRFAMIVIMMHIVVIILTFIYNIWLGIALAAFFLHQHVVLDKIYKDVVDIYRPLFKDINNS